MCGYLVTLLSGRNMAVSYLSDVGYIYALARHPC